MMRRRRMWMMQDSVRSGRATHREVVRELRYPCTVVATVVALGMMFVLMSCQYVSLWLALLMVFLSWVATFAGTVAVIIAWCDELAKEGRRDPRDGRRTVR